MCSFASSPRCLQGPAAANRLQIFSIELCVICGDTEAAPSPHNLPPNPRCLLLPQGFLSTASPRNQSERFLSAEESEKR